MSAENLEVSAAAPNALQDFTSCPEWGTGGQFIYDPATKTRTRVTLPSTTDIQHDEAAPAAASTTKKGGTRA